MFGVLNINKPAGWTSRDVVNRVQRFVRPAKAGHAGTLDPLATGVLIVCVGSATRLINYAHRLPKAYRATFHLGQSSASDDVESNIEIHEGTAVPTLVEIEGALPPFVGTIMQQPPAYSAIHVDGERAYKLARQGRSVELAARPVTIHSISVVSYEYPELTLDVVCGTGTYIRSLGRDLATSLGSRAVMSSLVRTWIGNLSIEQSIELRELEKSVEDHLLSPQLLVEPLPSVTLTRREIEVLRRGHMIAVDEHRIQPANWPTGSIETEIAGFDHSGNVVAILKSSGGESYRPVRNFNHSR